MKLKPPQTNADLDLMPVMNLFSILIPFLLSVAVFQKIAIVPVFMPERGDVNQLLPEFENHELKLDLSVFLTNEGIKIWAWNREFLEEKWDWSSMDPEGKDPHSWPKVEETLTELQNKGADMPDSDQAILISEDSIRVQQVIKAMDLLRERGFSEINLARLGAP